MFGGGIMELFKVVKHMHKEVSVTMERKSLETTPKTFNGIMFNIFIGNPGCVNKRMDSYNKVSLVDCYGHIEILMLSNIHSITPLE
jgi:hypothetical protein